jgi:outer membrane cobalamin receptor
MGSASAVSIAGAGRIEHEFVLRLAPVASQVVVTGSKLSETMLDSPSPVRQLDRGQMQSLGARGLNDALQEQPEVVTFAGGAHAHGGSTNLQGSTSRNVEILLDGQPLSGRVSGYIDLNQIDSAIVESVEVKTGASAMTYGLQGQEAPSPGHATCRRGSTRFGGKRIRIYQHRVMAGGRWTFGGRLEGLVAGSEQRGLG